MKWITVSGSFWPSEREGAPECPQNWRRAAPARIGSISTPNAEHPTSNAQGAISETWTLGVERWLLDIHLRCHLPRSLLRREGAASPQNWRRAASVPLIDSSHNRTRTRNRPRPSSSIPRHDSPQTRFENEGRGRVMPHSPTFHLSSSASPASHLSPITSHLPPVTSPPHCPCACLHALPSVIRCRRVGRG